MTPAELPASPQALRALGLAAVIDPAAWAEVPSSQDDPAASTPDPSPSSGASPTPSPTPSLAPRPAPRPAPTPYLPPGIDISRYDGSVDMQLVRSAGVRFVYAKATQGSTIDDTWYADHVAAARAGGIAFGSYHFFDYRQDGVAQADHFVDAMAANGALLDSLPPAVDVECLLSMGQSDRRAARTRLRALVDRVYQRTGRIAMIYTSAHMWAHVTGNDLTFGANPLWVACWSCDKPILPRGWNTWTLWQVGPLRVPGITRRFDGDVAAGGDAAVEALRSRQMVVEDDAPLTTGGAVRLQLQGLDGSHVRTSVDHQTWSDWTPRAAAGRVALDGPDGERHVRVQARDARGTLGPVVSDGIVLDATAPVASAPRITLRAGILGPGARSIPVRVAWSVADHVSGVVSAQVHADCDGTSLTTGDLGAERSAPRLSITGFVDDVLAPGARCVSSASAEDAAGNRADSGDKSVTVRLVQEAPSGAVVYSPGWRPVVSATASGGALRTAMALDRWVHFRFDGTQIALVTARGPGRGRVAITIDGVPTATVDLGSTTRASRLVVFRKQLPAGRHTIEVRTMGTVHTPRTGARVDIDGFLVIGP